LFQAKGRPGVRSRLSVYDHPSVGAASRAAKERNVYPVFAYRHPRTPWYAKVLAALVVGYAFSPIDPIPDFIPGVGLLDEMVVVAIGVLIAAKMIPADVFAECREKARGQAEKPVSRVTAVVVLAV
jgi:uncharacterized membrane protein YkvA (DUF1232 family)